MKVNNSFFSRKCKSLAYNLHSLFEKKYSWHQYHINRKQNHILNKQLTLGLQSIKPNSKNTWSPIALSLAQRSKKKFDCFIKSLEAEQNSSEPKSTHTHSILNTSI